MKLAVIFCNCNARMETLLCANARYNAKHACMETKNYH